MAPAVSTYEPRDPSRTVLYKVIAEYLETFLASLDADPAAKGLPATCNVSFTTICSVASSPMAFCAWDVRPARKRSSWPSVASGGGFVPRVRAGGCPDGGPPGRARHSLGADAPMGGVSAHPLAVLDGGFTGAVSLERLAEDANGDLMYTFNRPWSDGTTGIKLSPLELLEKLAALAPATCPPRALCRLPGAA